MGCGGNKSRVRDYNGKTDLDGNVLKKKKQALTL